MSGRVILLPATEKGPCMHRKKVLLLALCGLLSVFALRAQQLAEDEVRHDSRPYTPNSAAIRAQSNLVEVRVVVRDRNGRVVAGLSKNDFQLLDNGNLQRLSSFSVETAEPRNAATAPSAPTAIGKAPPSRPAASSRRFIALFFDDTNMKMGDLEPARVAAKQYIETGLDPDDLLSIHAASNSVTTPFTNDTPKLLEAISRVSSHYKSPGDSAASCPRISALQAQMIVERNDTRARDLGEAEGIMLNCLNGLEMLPEVRKAIVESRAHEVYAITDMYAKESLNTIQIVMESLARMPGRRMLMLTSSGFFAATSSLMRRQDELVDIAMGFGIVVNSLDAKGLVGGAVGGDPDDGPPVSIAARPDLMLFAERLRVEQRDLSNEPLSLLAGSTGGRFFHNSNDLARGFREISALPEVTYVLSFAPPDLKPDGSYHNIKVKLTTSGNYSLDARRGYFAPVAPKPGQLTVAEKFDAAIVSTAADVTTVPVTITTRAENSADAERKLNVILHVDTRNLRFERRGERSVQRLRFAAALYSLDGHFVNGYEAIMDLALKEASRKTLAADGLDEQLTLRAPAGSYRLRAVVQELVENRISTLTRPVTIE